MPSGRLSDAILAPVAIDWSEGDYGHTATQLEPIAIAVVKRLGIAAGQRVLDVGCGTGNAALAAARAGAAVTGVDPAAGLLALAQRRAEENRLDVELLRGDTEKLPVAGAFDVVMSVFGVIFAADAPQAAREMIRATRPGGVVALTSWCPDGGINAAAEVLWDALPKPEGPVNRWGDPQWVESLLTRAGSGRVTIDEADHVFQAESPEAFFTENEELHPVWRWARRRLSAERWDLIRSDSVATLRSWNEDAGAFAATSRYLLVQATR